MVQLNRNKKTTRSNTAPTVTSGVRAVTGTEGAKTENTEILLVTSFKGGVGKSTVAANLSYRLAEAGKKVLLCDLDLDVRSLDLIMGYEDTMIFDICDVCSGRIKAQDAWIKDARADGLYFIGAPYKKKELPSPDDFARCIRRIASDEAFDYVILDTPGADTPSLGLAKSCAEQALVVTNHNPCAVRGAIKSGEAMEQSGIVPYLIINSFDPAAVLDGRRDGMLGLIDSTHISLLGVVPYDRALIYAQEKGILSVGRGFVSSVAFKNIAQRLAAKRTGERPVPILKGVIKKRKKLLTK